MKLPHHALFQPRPSSEAADGSLSRRDLMRHCSHAAWALPTVWALGGCTTSESPLASATSSTTQSFGSQWATGGTSQISAAVRASNPFLSAAASRCQMTCGATIGPCLTGSLERIDISDGWNGLPMAMQLRVVDMACQPVEGAVVEVWHTNYTGGYSGDIDPMCNNNAADLKRQFFRGWQRSDKEGVVRFESCYPGWYGGRAVHVHVRILKGAYDPKEEATSWLVGQLLFTDELNRSIFASEPLYQSQGQPDTRFDTDMIMGLEPDPSPYLFDVTNIDGVMLASKTLVIRDSLDEALCQARGSLRPNVMPSTGSASLPPPPRRIP